MARSVVVVAVGASALAGALSSCSAMACTSDARSGLAVTVVEADGTPICDADVSVVLPDAVEKPSSYAAADGSCPYYGAMERPGTYSIRVTSDGRSQRMDDVEVTKGECHVHLKRVAVVFATTSATS